MFAPPSPGDGLFSFLFAMLGPAESAAAAAAAAAIARSETVLLSSRSSTVDSQMTVRSETEECGQRWGTSGGAQEDVPEWDAVANAGQ